MPLWPVRFDLTVDFGDPRLSAALVNAAALAQALHSLPLPPSVRERLNTLNIVRAVRGTTGIEGANLTEQEVQTILRSPGTAVLPNVRQREELEARNAGAVIEYISSVLTADPQSPLTEAVICEIHELTTAGIRYEHNVPGQYRSHAVSAGSYIPPRTNAEVRGLMRQFVSWLNSPRASAWPPVARAIAAHFYFISIHPFGDGNGRTARAIESYLLFQARINALGFYSLANFYYRERAAYIEKLDEVRFGAGGSLNPFLVFACEGLVDELRAAFDEVRGELVLVAFRDHARSELERAGKLDTPAGARMLAFLSRLGAERERISTIMHWGNPAGQPYARVSSKTFSRDLKLLEELGLIGRGGGYVWARVDVVRDNSPR